MSHRPVASGYCKLLARRQLVPAYIQERWMSASGHTSTHTDTLQVRSLATGRRHHSRYLTVPATVDQDGSGERITPNGTLRLREYRSLT